LLLLHQCKGLLRLQFQSLHMLDQNFVASHIAGVFFLKYSIFKSVLSTLSAKQIDHPYNCVLEIAK
jgi:hypothetical protein